MLRELRIENIAIIEKAAISFGPGLNVLTGETGAGKSIIIDAIAAVTGARAGRDLVRTDAERAVVTAVFDRNDAEDWLSENDIDCDDELILQRRINSDGKSSCRVCSSPVTAGPRSSSSIVFPRIFSAPPSWICSTLCAAGPGYAGNLCRIKGG